MAMARSRIPDGPSAGPPESFAWLAQLLPALAAGLALRLYLLPDQILLDDEWHSLNYVIGKPLFSILSRQGVGANSLPQNLYSHLLLRATGWSEMLLRFPSVLCGALALVILPAMVRKLWNERTAVFFSYILAVSPCLIFYSRVYRSYAVVVLAGTVSLLSLYRWVKGGGRAPMVLYAVGAFLGMYSHLFSAFLLAPPLFVLAAWKAASGLRFLPERLRAPATLPSYARLAQAAAIEFGLAAVFIAPPNLANPWWLHGLGEGEAVKWRTVLEYWSLLSGTHAAAPQAAFLAAAACGLYLVLRKDAAVGVLIASSFAAFALKAVSSRYGGGDTGILWARFGILSLPLTYLLASVSVSRLLEKAAAAFPAAAPRACVHAAGAAAAAVLFLLGPLPGIYRAPNNFTNHSAFQYTYEPTDWSVSRERQLMPGFRTRREDIPPFYAALAADPAVAGIIEYPMMIGDHFNPFYYYQLFHRKPTAAGYISFASYPPISSGDDYVFGDTPVNYVLSRAAKAARFRNIAALDDWERLRKSFPGWVIIVHHDLPHEAFPGRFSPNAAEAAGMKEVVGYMTGRGAVTAYRSDQLTALTIPR